MDNWKQEDVEIRCSPTGSVSHIGLSCPAWIQDKELGLMAAQGRLASFWAIMEKRWTRGGQKEKVGSEWEERREGRLLFRYKINNNNDTVLQYTCLVSYFALLSPTTLQIQGHSKVRGPSIKYLGLCAFVGEYYLAKQQYTDSSRLKTWFNSLYCFLRKVC